MKMMRKNMIGFFKSFPNEENKNYRNKRYYVANAQKLLNPNFLRYDIILG